MYRTQEDYPTLQDVLECLLRGGRWFGLYWQRALFDIFLQDNSTDGRRLVQLFQGSCRSGRLQRTFFIVLRRKHTEHSFYSFKLVQALSSQGDTIYMMILCRNILTSILTQAEIRSKLKYLAGSVRSSALLTHQEQHYCAT